MLCVFAPCRSDGQWFGSPAADRARLAEITNTPVAPAPARAKLGPLTLVPPALELIWNSEIPFTFNDGPLWAGRGLNGWVAGGVSGATDTRHGSVRLVVAPLLAFSQNLPFPIFPGTAPDRSFYSSPFHGPGNSADLPLRFGDRHLLRIDPGASEIAFERRNARARLTAANDWWGPGVRNALVMSSHAAGVPRIEVSTIRPIPTRAGAVTIKAIAGALTESNFFDRQPNDYRSLSGAIVTLRPAFDSNFTVGLSRVVYAVIESPLIGPLAHSLDVLTRWEYIGGPGDTTASGSPRQRADQIAALFARWVFPEAGLEAYAEWARMDLPKSPGELLVAPHHSGGYTIGLQYAVPRGANVLRLQTEFTYVEQSRVFRDRPSHDFYAGRASSQGYTQRGQAIGAAIGPGGSSQWLALDHFAPRWHGGVFAGRIRWENDALYRQFAPNFMRHDVTVFGGARGSLRSAFTDVSAEITYGYRFNYLFQNGFASPGGVRTVDKRNLTLRLSATPR